MADLTNYRSGPQDLKNSPGQQFELQICIVFISKSKKKNLYFFIEKGSFGRNFLALVRLLYLTHLRQVWCIPDHWKCCFMLCSGLFFIASGKQKYLFRIHSSLSVQVFDVRSSLICTELQALTPLSFSSRILWCVVLAVRQRSSLILPWFFKFTSNLRVGQTDFHEADLLSLCLEEIKKQHWGIPCGFPKAAVFTGPGKPEVLGLTRCRSLNLLLGRSLGPVHFFDFFLGILGFA